MNIHILKASGRFDALEQQIRTAIDEGLEKIEKKISLPEVDIVVRDNPLGAIPETGSGGLAPETHLMYIDIDPESPHIRDKKAFAKELQSTLAHELNHCARWHAIGYRDTLLEAIVSEGLADHFDIEVNGDEPKPWSVAIQGKELEELKEKARPVFDEKHDHPAWFFGEGGDLPRWGGYSLGFDIVGSYMEKTGKLASELTGEKAELFIK